MTGILHALLVASSGPQVSITNQSVSSSQTVSATAGYRLNSSGNAESRIQTSYATLEQWLQIGAASDYECRATLSSGAALNTGNLGVWESLGTSREWTILQGTIGSKTSDLLIEIRAASGATLDSATITLSAERGP